MQKVSIKNVEKGLRYVLKNKKLRNTKQRQQILKVFYSKGGHISVDELYDILKKKYPNIGYATVYRTLKLFHNIGLAEGLKIGNQKMLYEHKYENKHHDHLVCIKCGSLIEISSNELEDLQEKLAKKNDFEIIDHKLILYGFCSKCNMKVFNKYEKRYHSA